MKYIYKLIVAVLLSTFVLQIYYWAAYFNVSKRNRVVKDGITTYAYIYSKAKTRSSGMFSYRFALRRDTFEGSFLRRNPYIKEGDSILIIYSRSNPEDNLFINDTLISDYEMFLYNIF